MNGDVWQLVLLDLTGYDVHTNAGDVLEHMHSAHQRKLLLNTRASDGITVHEAVKAMV